MNHNFNHDYFVTKDFLITFTYNSCIGGYQMRTLLIFVFLIFSSISYSQYFFDGSGKRVARFDETRTYNASGKKIGRIDWDRNRVYDGSGKFIGRIDGKFIYDGSGRQIGRDDGKFLYSGSGKMIGRLDGDFLYDGSGKRIGRADGLQRMQVIIFFYYFY